MALALPRICVNELCRLRPGALAHFAPVCSSFSSMFLGLFFFVYLFVFCLCFLSAPVFSRTHTVCVPP